MIPKKGQGPAFSRVKLRYVIPEGDERPVITVTKLGKSPIGHTLYGFTCPECQFTFERTSVKMGVAWAREHGRRSHGDRYTVQTDC
jgi:hypothetical protein